MNVKTLLEVSGSDAPYVLVVEPWATEYEILPKDNTKLVIMHPSEIVALAVEIHTPRRLIVWVNAHNATYQFWRNGTLEDDVPIETP